MKSADVDRRLTKEADANLIAAAIRDRERYASSDRNVAAHDSMPAKKIQLLVEEVHRTALAAGAACRTTEQLSHDLLRRHSASQRKSVIAVCRDHVVIWSKRRHRASRNRFLPDI